jgi:type VI secretion system secreted protein VgrG
MAGDLFHVEGTGLDQAELVGFRGFEALSACYEISVYVTVPDPSVFDDALGEAMSLWCDYPPAHPWNGVIAEVELLHEMQERTLVRLLMVPRLWLLGLTSHSRMFTKKAMPDVIKEVLELAGLSAGSDFELRLGSYAPEEHICQYRESDLSFVQRWLEREGVHYFFVHADGAEKLIISDDSSGEDAVLTEPVVYHPKTPGEDGSEEVSYHRFSETRHARPSKVKVGDYDYLNPPLDVGGEANAHPNGFGDVVRFGGDRVFSPGDAKRLAGIEAEAHMALQTRFVGIGRALHVRSGHRFTLAGHIAPKLDQEYLTVRIEHMGNLGATSKDLAARCGLVVDETYLAEVTAIASGVVFRPTRSAAWPRVHGWLTGVVDGSADSDYAQIDDQGRYTITLKLDETSHSGGQASTAIRMMQPHAGNPEGMHFPLRKGTEVMVTFLDGDPDRPLIAGAIPNAHTPSVVTSSNYTHNVIHTGGDNRMDFEDQAGGQWIHFSTPTKNTYLHLGKPFEDWTHHVILHTDGDGLFDIGSNQDILVGGMLQETVDGAVKETYKASQTSNVTGNQKTTVDAATEEIYCSTQDTLTVGNVTEKYEVPHSTTVSAAPRDEMFMASQTTKVTGGLTQQHNGAHTRVVAGNTDTTHSTTYERHVTGAVSQLYGGNVTRLMGTNNATYDTLNMIVPGGWTDIFVARQVQIPGDLVVKLTKTNVYNVALEVAQLSWAFVGAKASATGVAIGGQSFKAEATGVARTVTGGSFGIEALEGETKGGPNLKLGAIVIKL